MIRCLDERELADGANVIAAAMAQNPIHVAAWPDPATRSNALRHTFLAGSKRPGRSAIGAFQDGRLVGIAGVSASGCCRPRPESAERLRDELDDVEEGAGDSYLAWRSGWRRHDPDDGHHHFGVLESHRGEGIGSRLFASYREALDSEGAPGYLEVDREENLGFYARRGFDVAAEDLILGVRCWFMSRPAGG